MKKILFSASLLLMAISVYGQTAGPQPQPCTLKLSQAPSVRGVKLDMTLDELFALFPGSSNEGRITQALSQSEGYDRFGEAGFSIAPTTYSTKDRFAGISVYFVDSFDRRIVSFTAVYDRFPKGPRWHSVDDLIQRFAESFHLPEPEGLDPGWQRQKIEMQWL